MRVLRSWWFPLVLLSAGAGPRFAWGQARVEFGPVIAAYAPLGEFRQTTDRLWYVGTLPASPSALGALAWGAQGRLWVSPRFGLQLQAVLASSRWHTEVNTPGGSYFAQNSAQVMTATAEVLYRPAPNGLPIWLSAGSGIVRHWGQAYADAGVAPMLALGGAVGLGLDLRILRRLTATLGVSTLLYPLDARDKVGSLEHGFQTDLLAHVALVWRSP